MGAEAVCSVSYGGQVSEGKALLESSELIFRGAFRLRIPFSEITSLARDDATLRVGYAGDVALFELGRHAEAWAEKIRNPRGLLEKLGVKPGIRVVVLGVDDPGFMSQLSARAAICDMLHTADADLVFYAVNHLADLARLRELRAVLKPAGAIWVVSPKGMGVEVKDTDVIDEARHAGLVDTKVVSFSQTQTSLKLVIPKAQR